MSTHYLALNLPEKIQVDSWGEAQRPVLKQSQEGRLTYPEVKETLVRTRTLWSSGFSLTVVQTVLWILEVGLWV